MIQIQEKSKCCGCHGCAQVCPKQCIEMVADEEGFYYPKVDESRCIHCGLCEKVCPVLQAKPDDPEKQSTAFAAQNRNEEIRWESSSGGVFSLLAEQVIARGGVVFGAAWTEDFRAVQHIAVREESQLDKLRRSKYVQSSIGNCYAQAKEVLERGEQVLFTGTPCQIEGLRQFLRKDYENLLCVDLVCHGVPAPGVWRRYLTECEKKKGALISSVSFRDKTTGWKDFCVTLNFENGKRQFFLVGEDPYMRAFLRNACLRPSCHDCRFKKRCRESDLTLADFWGIEKFCPQMDDDKGTSLVLVHSPAGQAALDAVRHHVTMEPVDFVAALRENPCATISSHVHENREVFQESLKHMSFSRAVKRWLPRKISLRERVCDALQKAGLVEPIKKILGRK